MSAETQLKRTPLYESHHRLGARLVEFGGWEMPVQYDGILAEHNAVRADCGVFDISHMGEVRVSGPRAQMFLNHLLTNDLAKLAVGQGQYNLMCNERGGTVDDLYAYRIGDDEYLLIINASRIEADVPHIRHVAQVFLSDPFEAELQIENCSDYSGAIAVQGPRSAAVMEALLPGIASEVKRNRIVWRSLAGENALVARTGYTGEDGFELVMPAEAMAAVWELLLKQGAKPCGLGARDTLRTEMCYPLYGHELDEETSAIEAGLGKFVALGKPAFVGKEHLQRQSLSGTSKTLVAFRMNGRSAPPRPHYPLVVGGEAVGEVTSGTQSPSLGVGIGMGYVPPICATGGQVLEVEIRGKRFPAEIVAKPIYRKNG
ncbi:MAG: glycine cleavage system aminomethyltransferase GcvT [Verrucomicrobia bacterium]|nr:glycine cleavage system aminomethyltransferase GcvT [Verrucomicrobiota bacterium]